MIFKREQYDKLYDEIYDWLTGYTPGGRCHISRLKRYQKEVWNPIIEMIEMLSKKEELSKKEKEFLDLVIYNGPIYRVQRYNPRYKGHVYESDFYQSWSRNLEGVANVPTIYGDILLIVGQANKGIDIFRILRICNKK